jgi:hypothetical protein
MKGSRRRSPRHDLVIEIGVGLEGDLMRWGYELPGVLRQSPIRLQYGAAARSVHPRGGSERCSMVPYSVPLSRVQRQQDPCPDAQEPP